MDDQEYVARVEDFIAKYSREPHRFLGYFRGHLPRFLIGKNYILTIPLGEDSMVLEAGSEYPYHAIVPYTLYNSTCYVTSISPLEWNLPPKMNYYQSNLNFDDYGDGKWDLVILTEVLEHLPANLYNVRDRILKSIKSGGYLLSSFPLGVSYRGLIMVAPYEVELRQYDWNVAHDHLREFTEQGALDFMLSSGKLKLIDRTITYTREYGGNIMVCLFQKL